MFIKFRENFQQNPKKVLSEIGKILSKFWKKYFTNFTKVISKFREKL